MNYFFSCLFTIFFLSMPPPVTHTSLRDKIGQMLLIGFEGTQIDAQSPITKLIVEHNIGGVIFYDENIENPTQVKKLTQDLHEFNHQGNRNLDRPNLPLLISVDYEGGKVSRLNEKAGFPATLSAELIGKKGLETAEINARQMADTLAEYGFNLNFAPILDVNVNPDNPIIAQKERSFSSDPQRVSDIAPIYSRAFLQRHIQCVYKHFPGHGSSKEDSHLSFVDVSTTWKAYELSPYQILLQKDYDCGFIMTAHIVNRQLDDSGLPATLSYKMLTQLLRRQLLFQGVIITDDLQMKAISEHYGLDQALVLAINAGADMLIFGNIMSTKNQDVKQLIDIIERKVLNGEISKERIDEAYQHIVKMKKTISP